MGDKDAIRQLQERVKRVAFIQDRIKEQAALAATEKEERERQERP